MKRIVMIMMAVCGMMGAMAQDTLHSLVPPEGYWYERWADNQEFFVRRYGGATEWSVRAVRYTTEDTLIVYGMAISMVTEETYPVYDTTYDSCFEFVRLYQNIPRGDSLEMINEQKKVHINHTPISYYWDMGMYVPSLGSPMIQDIVPMYELYFDVPSTVVDSFYIGWTGYTQLERNRGYNVPGRGTYWRRHYPLLTYSLGSFGSDPKTAYDQVKVFWGYLPWVSSDSIWMWDHDTLGSRQKYCLVFPIVTPRSSDSIWNAEDSVWNVWDPVDSTWRPADSVRNPNDSTWNPGDSTMRIGSVEVADRYTQLVPNPATTEVRVVSSLGVRDVEVYDAGGRRVWKGVGEGMVTKIETGGWPRGVYMVKVSTRAGVATKRLLLK